MSTKKITRKLQVVVEVEVTADGPGIARSAIAELKRELSYSCAGAGVFGKTFGSFSIRTGRVREMKS